MCLSVYDSVETEDLYFGIHSHLDWVFWTDSFTIWSTAEWLDKFYKSLDIGHFLELIVCDST